MSPAMMRRRWVQALILWMAGFALPATALASCTLSYTNLNFGTYTGSAVTGNNQADVNCTSGAGWTLGLNAGTGSRATTTTRKMTGPGGALLSYQIFQDSARTVNWGNNSGVDTVSGTGTGANQVVQIYTRIAAGQLIQPGTYTDTISSSTASFTVTAVIQATCSFSATALAFGNYTGAQLDASSAITATCTNTTAYTIGLNAGTSAGATVTSRFLTATGGTEMRYALYSDSTRATMWQLTSNTVGGTGNGAAQNLSVYGRLPAGQYLKPGTYTDTITATITY